MSYTKPKGDSHTSISFSHTTQECIEKVFINTEDAIVMPTEILINDCKGVYMETYNEIKGITWVDEKYAFSLSGYGIEKEELIHLAESVKNIGRAPKPLKPEYMISADMNGYNCQELVVRDKDINVLEYYKNSATETTSIFFSQSLKGACEDIITKYNVISPTEITINNYRGYYSEISDHEKIVTWDTGKFILTIVGYDIGKDELITIAKTVQKIEN